MGSGGHGHVFPGASLPFGAVQLSPDTDNARWDACSGYNYDDKSVLGFSHTHLSGTGVSDMMDLLVVPAVGPVKLSPGSLESPENSYRKPLHHDQETAKAGYYSVNFPECGIRAELTATERAGFHRYTFPKGQPAHLLIDWHHGAQNNDMTTSLISDAHLKIVGNDTLVGSRRVGQWAVGRVIHFALKVSKPFAAAQLYSNDQPLPSDATLCDGAALKCALLYDVSLDGPLLVKVGLSSVDISGALNNLATEIPDWDFEKVREAAGSAWNRALSQIEIDTPSAADRTTFYTALYHLHLAPTLFDDSDGRYRGMDTKVHQLKAGQHNFSTYSLWDTYRSLHPLTTLIAPDRAAQFASNLIEMAEQSPDGPCIWPLQGIETHCMIGWHSAVVIAEALNKKLPGVDAARAWSVYRKLAFERISKGLTAYRKSGFIGADLEDQSVSKTLEYAYDDWAMACIADAAGDKQAAEALRTRSKNYKNVFDKKLQFARPRLQSGEWAEPFDPVSLGHDALVWWDYTESNSWQATFLNQHDIYNFIELFGGDIAFEAKLDALFSASSKLSANAPPDMSGLIGQYVHGNEPSHHIAYLYTFAGAPHKTQAMISKILKTQYTSKPDGLSGNEDCGQMSAWFVMSALGFYPVDPVSGIYVFGSPLFPKAVISLPNGKQLRIVANNVDEKNIYIKAIHWQGRRYDKTWIAHDALMAGGDLVFTMSDQPDLTFGKSMLERPPSFTLSIS